MRHYYSRETITKKIRRHSGREFGKPTINASKRYIIENCLEPHEYWNDWNDYRDGMRGDDDRTKIQTLVYNCICEECFINTRHTWNKKNKKMLKIRKAKKMGRYGVIA